MLRAEEASDKIPVPLWLRVHWRKAHPEGSYVGLRPDRRLSAGAEGDGRVDAAPPGPGGDRRRRPAGPRPRGLRRRGEGPARKGDRRHQRPHLGRADRPRAASRTSGSTSGTRSKIIAASNNIGGTGQQAQYYSSNGGATWGQSFLPLPAGDSFHSDPTVDWTSDGTAWSTTIGINGRHHPQDARLQVDQRRRHLDLRRHVLRHPDEHRQADDVGRPQRHLGLQGLHLRLWHNGNPAFVNRRTGPAGSWRTPIQVSGAETTGTAIGATSRPTPPATSSSSGRHRQPAHPLGQVHQRRRRLGRPGAHRHRHGRLRHRRAVDSSRRALIYVSGGAYRTATKNLSTPPGPTSPAPPAAPAPPTSRAPTPPPPARPASGSPAPPTAAPPGARRR